MLVLNSSGARREGRGGGVRAEAGPCRFQPAPPPPGPPCHRAGAEGLRAASWQRHRPPSGREEARCGVARAVGSPTWRPSRTPRGAPRACHSLHLQEAGYRLPWGKRTLGVRPGLRGTAPTPAPLGASLCGICGAGPKELQGTGRLWHRPRGQGARVGLPGAILYFLKTLCSEKKREAQHLGRTTARAVYRPSLPPRPHVCSLL